MQAHEKQNMMDYSEYMSKKNHDDIDEVKVVQVDAKKQQEEKEKRAEEVRKIQEANAKKA